jgi:hypothetical protein
VSAVHSDVVLHDVVLYDTTLRDGAQREGISLSLGDKLRIIERLDRFGVAFIEGGWPGSNPKDAELFTRAKELRLETAVLCAFGSTRRPGVAAQDDDQVRALCDAGTSVVVSELAGRGNLLSHAEAIGVSLSEGEAREIVRDVKEHEARGYSFEAADGSVALRLLRARPDYRAPFELRDYKVLLGREGARAYAEATVKVEVAGIVRHTAAEGSGPVQALDRALRAALAPLLPAIDSIRLTDYKVRILDGKDGTDATTRVLITSSDGVRSFSTVGASANILEASCVALVEAFEHGLAITPAMERAS